MKASQQEFAPPLIRIQSSPVVSQLQSLLDCLFLGVVVLISLAPYIGTLGLYSDDWVFLGLLIGAHDHSVPGLIRALYAGDIVIRQRPAQIVYLAVLYRLVGLRPLGYHVANAAVLVSGTVFFYLTFRELRFGRLIAVSVPLVYALFPSYSTDRFWVAAFQAPLSITLYLLSLYADLRALKQPQRSRRRYVLRMIAVLSLIGSSLAYEVTLALFLLNMLVVWHQARYLHNSDALYHHRTIGPLTHVPGNLIALVAVIVFKAAITVRVNVPVDYVAHVAHIVRGSLQVNYGVYGIALPYVMWWIVRNDPGSQILILSVGVGLATFAYLTYLQYASGQVFPEARYWLKVVGWGGVVFVLGYAIFLTSADINFSSTSLDNRINIGAALGVALSLVSGIGCISSLLPGPALRRRSFNGLVAVLCMCGCIIINTLASFWITAYQQQQTILHDIRAHVVTVPSESTLILDGVCMEHGGAYSFTGHRDLAALLGILYGRQDFRATAVTNPPKIEQQGISLLVHGHYDFYPYSERLLVYSYQQKEVTRLTDMKTTQEYFRASGFDPHQDCAPGFAWGWNAAPHGRD